MFKSKKFYCIGGVMVSMLTQTVVDLVGSSPDRVKPKKRKLVFVAKHTVLRRKSEDWSGYIVSEWCDMFICGLLFQ
jgi:hypothetical protein